jgi:hypothetical protein
MANPNDRVTDIPADEADERVLRQRLAQGDQIAFWAIWTLYRKDLFAYCLRCMGGNRETENARKRAQQARSILRMALAGDCPGEP